MAKISGSVGYEGRNVPGDVLLVQSLLNVHIGGNTQLNKWLKPISCDGQINGRSWTDPTVTAIVIFQREIMRYPNPAGRIDPGGKTLRRLEGKTGEWDTPASENGLVLELSSRPPDAYLADFEIGGHDLKPDHTAWLEENIVQSDKAKSRGAVNGQWLVRLTSRASQSGSNAYNLELSKRRGDEVEKFLSSRIMAHRLGFARISLGEDIPLDSSIYENEMDRSVHVKAKFLRWGKPERIEPLIPEIKPWRRVNKKSVDFTIRVIKARVRVLIAGSSVVVLPITKGTIEVFLFLEVRELGTGDTALYEFKGFGPFSQLDKPGATFSEWQGTFENGDKHRFSTERPMDAEDFGGSARMQIDRPNRGFCEPYIFGLDDSFLFPTEFKIRKLTFGLLKEAGLDPPNLGGSPGVFGKMKLINVRPSWAS